jgi:hypothetical protein
MINKKKFYKWCFLNNITSINFSSKKNIDLHYKKYYKIYNNQTINKIIKQNNLIIKNIYNKNLISIIFTNYLINQNIDLIKYLI